MPNATKISNSQYYCSPIEAESDLQGHQPTFPVHSATLAKDSGAETILYWEICKSLPVYTVLQARSLLTVTFPQEISSFSVLRGDKDITATGMLPSILGNLGLQILKPEPQNIGSFQ